MVGSVSGIVDGRERFGITLLLSKRVLDGVVEYWEVHARLIRVKARFGREVWVFVSSDGPGNLKNQEDREAFCSELLRCVEGRKFCR